jgi:hypothetical protein
MLNVMMPLKENLCPQSENDSSQAPLVVATRDVSINPSLTAAIRKMAMAVVSIQWRTASMLCP